MGHLPLFKITYSFNGRDELVVSERRSLYSGSPHGTLYLMRDSPNFYKRNPNLNRYKMRDLVNELLRIDYLGFLGDVSRIVCEFRESYPIDMALTKKASHIQMKRDSGYILVADGEPAAAVDVRRKFFSSLRKNAKGKLSDTTGVLLWRFFSFSIQDDIWLARRNNQKYDKELFDSWGIECSKIISILEASLSLGPLCRRGGDVASSFDCMLGIDRFRDALPRISDVNPKWANHKLECFGEATSRSVSERGKGNTQIEAFNINLVIESLFGLLYLSCLDLSKRYEKYISYDGEMFERMDSTLYKWARMPGASFDFVHDLKVALEDANCLYDSVKSCEGSFNVPKDKAPSRELGYLVSLIESLTSYFDRALCDYGPRGAFLRSLVLLEDELSANVEMGFIATDLTIRWFSRCWTYEVETFPAFLKGLLSSVLHGGAIAKKCKQCGGLFFPEMSNQRYCDRIDPATEAKCGTRAVRAGVTERNGRMNKKVQKVKLKARSAKGKCPRANTYFEDLVKYIRKEVNPLYAPLVDGGLFCEWLDDVAKPKRGEVKDCLPGNLPYSMIWGDKIIDGTEWVNVSSICKGDADFLATLRDLNGGYPFELKDVSIISGSSTFVKASWLLRSVLRYNKKYPDALLPIPGLDESSLYQLVDSASLSAKQIDIKRNVSLEKCTKGQGGDGILAGH